MEKYKIILFEQVLQEEESAFFKQLSHSFEICRSGSLEECRALLESGVFKALVLQLSTEKEPDFFSCESLIQSDELDDGVRVPVLLLSPSGVLDYKLKAFELGCDDFITPDVSMDEICLRINKSVYNCVANEQLKSRLKMANDMAYSVMSDNSDLGASIQFLLDANFCDNLDQLGQLFFTSIERYGLSCSLQMRSLYGVKNMDANGLERDLESQLLEQMKNAGRYVDFGRRTIVNYDQASLLVRNMPDPKDRLYGAFKDNSFAMIQGLDARVKALDRKQKLLDEQKSIHQISADVQSVTIQIEKSYRSVIQEIVNVVEDMAESIANRIPVLALSEEQELFFEQVTQNCVTSTNEIFNKGLKTEEHLKKLSDSVDQALRHTDFLNESEESADKLSTKNQPWNKPKGSVIELF